LYKGFSRKTAFTGDFFKASVRDIKPESRIKKKTKVHGILVRTKKEIYRHDGTSIKFDYNSGVLLKKRLTPRGTELYGPATKFIRRKKFISSFSGLI
jgi:large subunit ribosomal protein L14